MLTNFKAEILYLNYRELKGSKKPLYISKGLKNLTQIIIFPFIIFKLEKALIQIGKIASILIICQVRGISFKTAYQTIEYTSMKGMFQQVIF